MRSFTEDSMHEQEESKIFFLLLTDFFFQDKIETHFGRTCNILVLCYTHLANQSSGILVSCVSNTACLNTQIHLNASFLFCMLIPALFPLPSLFLYCLNDFSWGTVQPSTEAIRKFYLQETGLCIHVTFINNVLLEVSPILDQMLRN